MTLLISIKMPRGPYIYISVVTTLMATAFSISSFINERKENKKFNKKLNEVYLDYLLNKRIELNEMNDKYIMTTNYNNLNPMDIKKEILNNSNRLYERSIIDEDFLNIRIGLADVKPHFKLENPGMELSLSKTPLEEECEDLYHDFVKIKDFPRISSLKVNNLGLVGNMMVAHTQLHSILMQLMFYHSYHDLKFIYILNEKELEEFDYLKWSNHSKINEAGNKTFVFNEQTRDNLLSGLMQLFRSREEDDKAGLPILIFVITNYELIASHPIMEFLNKDHLKYGFRLLFLADSQENLINNITTVIDYKNPTTAEIILEEKKLLNEHLKLDHYNMEQVSDVTRHLCPLEHIQGVSSSIPKAIGFLEMYNLDNVEDLDISSRWDNNRTYKSIKALVGKKSETDYTYLDLHEKVHGPHGLVAGTTGSGKSEVIQTYILSLCLNYSPYEVGVLLIDYKGGGMANLFKDMPHHLGSITNLDGYQAMRAMASIKSELKRRQQIFADNDVNHINDYLKLFEAKRVEEPLPHLFLISDEFAELKSEQPDFMKELVSAARIGRSLGVHLILATQKPAGVVDDQIWSNSKFKLCLKVAEEADSKELLKTPDAAYIKEAGRGYLKVGTNELYELFQSGYSGLKYTDEKVEHKDTRIYLVDINGNKKLLNEDLSGHEESIDDITELDAVLNEISRVYNSKGYIEVAKPWLPPLESLTYMDHTITSQANTLNLITDIGLIDLPDQQSQIPLRLNFREQTSLVILGSPQTGKTSTMATILLTLALQNTSEMCKFYILDYGNGGLLQLKQLNHTADYLKVDEEDKLLKLDKLIKKEVKYRKKLLEDKVVTNITSYNEISDTKLGFIVIAVDNYDVIRDINMEYEKIFENIVKDGASLGIYFIATAVRQGAFRMAMQSSISKYIVHFLTDKMDLNSAIGRSSYEMQEIQGRVQLKVDKPEVAQVFYKIEAADSKEEIQKMNDLIITINESNTHTHLPIPVMPEVVEMKPEYINPAKGIFIGLDYEEIEPNYIPLTENFNILGDSRVIVAFAKGKLKDIFTENTIVFDKTNKEMHNENSINYTSSMIDEFLEFDGPVNRLIFNDVVWATEITDITKKNSFLNKVKQYVDEDVHIVFLISNYSAFDELSKLAKLFENAIIIKNLNEQTFYANFGVYRDSISKNDLFLKTESYKKIKF